MSDPCATRAPLPLAMLAAAETDDEGLDFRPAGDILARQGALLAAHVKYAARHSPFYRALFARLGIGAAAIKSVGDLTRIPCTTKADLAEHNDLFLAAPRGEIVDVCLTSATTGAAPTRLMQTASDLARLARNEAGAFAMMGLRPGREGRDGDVVTDGDVVYIGAALDRCFMAGLAYFLGGWQGGLSVVRGGSGTAAQHWQLLKISGATAIMGVPSQMRRIAQFAREQGEDPAALGIRKLLTIGEPIRGEDMALSNAAARLETLWGARLYSTYASTELATTLCECSERRGGHLRPELAIIEILDDAGRPVGRGETGEVVATPLGVRGMPLVRFRTGDISFLIDEPCPCGRRTARLGPILGRRGQMLKYKGTTLYPPMILAALEDQAGIAGGYVEVRRWPDGTDRVIVRAAVDDGAVMDDASADQLLGRLRESLRARLRVLPEVELITPAQLRAAVIHPDKRKPVTFIDRRDQAGPGPNYLTNTAQCPAEGGCATKDNE